MSAFLDKQIEKLKGYVVPGKSLNLNTRTTYYSQRDNYTMPHRTCNSSSNAMYLDWLRRSTGREPLGGDNGYLSKVLSIGDTIYHEVQTQAIKSYGFSTQWNTDGDFDKVVELLDAGIPVVVNILHRGSLAAPRGGHIIMLVAYKRDQGILLCQDPYGTLQSNYSDSDGRLDVITVRIFKRRWQGGYRTLDVD